MIEERCCYYMDSTNSVICSLVNILREERGEKYWLPAANSCMKKKKALPNPTFNQNDLDKILQTGFNEIDIFIHECYNICVTTRPWKIVCHVVFRPLSTIYEFFTTENDPYWSNIRPRQKFA